MKAHIRWSLKDIEGVVLTANRERMYVLLNGVDHKPVIDRLKGIFGIQSLSPAIKIERDLEVMKTAALYYLNHTLEDVNTFKITTKRADKDFPYNTDEINRALGGHFFGIQKI